MYLLLDTGWLSIRFTIFANVDCSGNSMAFIVIESPMLITPESSLSPLLNMAGLSSPVIMDRSILAFGLMSSESAGISSPLGISRISPFSIWQT